MQSGRARDRTKRPLEKSQRAESTSFEMIYISFFFVIFNSSFYSGEKFFLTNQSYFYIYLMHLLLVG